MIGNELLPLVKADSRGERHSQNLMKWIRKHRKLPLFVAYSPVSCIDGSDIGPFNPAKTLASQLYIGYGDIDDGFVFGSRLSEILCSGVKAKEWAYPPRHRFKVLPDWWQGYITGGKCHIDPEHRLYGGRERWAASEDGKTRSCIWCGEHTQYLCVKMVERTSWESVPQ